jgi:hypothetical protein
LEKKLTRKQTVVDGVLKVSTVWGTKSQHCMGLPDEIISWGGPIAVFRWDNAKDVDIKDFIVREIQDTN